MYKRYENENSRPLTKQDIAAIKKANDSVCFDFVENGMTYETYAHGQMRIRLGIREKWDNCDARYDYSIPVSGLVDCFSSHKPTNGFGYIGSPSVNDEWKSIASFLRTGDIVKLRFVGDNNNQYLEKYNLHHDQLFLDVIRGKKHYTFFVEESTCEQNSGRMLRMGEFNQFAV